MFGSIGGSEILLILLVILIFFGAKRIPELARGIGQGMNEFKKATDDIKKEIEEGKKTGFSSAPQKEEPAKETKEDVMQEKKAEEKQEKSTEN